MMSWCVIFVVGMKLVELRELWVCLMKWSVVMGMLVVESVCV